MNSTSNSAPRSTKRRDPEPIEIGNALHYWIGPHRKAEWILSVLQPLATWKSSTRRAVYIRVFRSSFPCDWPPHVDDILPSLRPLRTLTEGPCRTRLHAGDRDTGPPGPSLVSGEFSLLSHQAKSMNQAHRITPVNL